MLEKTERNYFQDVLLSGDTAGWISAAEDSDVLNVNHMFLIRSNAAAATLSLCLFFASFTVSANEQLLLDCSLRDAAFGLDIPLMDILLSSQAKALVEQEVPGLLMDPYSFEGILHTSLGGYLA